MKEHKMKQVAIQMMKKLKDIDLDKVSAITIGIQMSGDKKEDHYEDADEDYEENKETEEA